MLSSLLDAIFPPRCAACRAPATHGPFCWVCAEAIDPVPDGCRRCAAPGPAALCGGCAADPPAFDAVLAGGLFGGPLADAVHELKYRDRPALGRALGAWLASRVPLPPAAAVVSVPLGRARRLARGYDQAALVADAVARAARLPRLRGALRRTRETPPQVGRTRVERARNVDGAFSVARPVRGRDCLLVDDVLTTGATADACAAALKRAGARSVRVLAIGRAE
jgi:ComF family protein